jgi:hypothetical protein
MRIIIATAILFSLSACGIGAVTPVRQYGTSETIQLTRAPTNFVDTAQEVGRSLGYRIAGIDRAKNSVSLSDSMLGGVGSYVTGKMKGVTITLTLLPGGREIAFDYVGFGNMGSVNQTKANQKLAQLKAALQDRLRERQ